MKKRYILGTLLLILIIAAGGYVYLTNQKPQPPKTSQKPTVNRTLPKEVTITLDKNGFSPKEVTIKQGTAVRWKNISGKEQTVNSDDHPSHQKHRELNFGIFKNGSTVAFVFKKPGTYEYHNHLQPEHTGKIVVEK